MVNPYHDWLKIPRSIPQPDYYQLLGFTKEDYKADLLDQYYFERFECVRRFEQAPGIYGELAQSLLAELSKARETLRDGEARRYYDESLRLSRAEESTKNAAAGGDTIAERVSSGARSERVSPGTSSERVRENSSQSATPQHEQQEIIDAIVVERIPRLANQIPTNPMSAMIAEASGQPWAETLSDAERVPTSAAAVRHPAEGRHAAWPIERQAGSATIPLRSTSSGSVATPGSSPFAPLNDSQGETGERDGGALAELDTPFSASDVGLGSGNWVTRMIMMWTMLMLLWLAFVVVAGLLLQITGVCCLIVGIVWFLYGCASALARTTSLGTNRRPSQSTNSLVGGVSTVAVALLLISLGQWSWRIQSRQSAEEVARREQVVQAIEEASLAIEQNKMAKAIELVDQVRLLADPTEQRVINIIRHVSQLSLVTARRDASNADIRQILIEGRAFLAGKETLRAKERLQEVLAIPHAPGHPDVIKFADEIVLMHVEDAENHLQASSFNQARLSAEEALRVPGTNLKKIAQRMLQRVNEQEAAYGRRGGFE